MTPDRTTSIARATGAFSALLLAACLSLVAAAPALGLAPHVPTDSETDACAMCHRSHTAPNDDTWTTSETIPTERSSLLLGEPGTGDVSLCYACHGMDALGSTIDVQGSFESSSAHKLTPGDSAFGPAEKDCSTCHDSHGTSRNATDEPYPKLLRVRGQSGSVAYSGDGVCTGCHTVRAASLFPGADIWSKTAHARIAPPASGTGVVCSACHDPHGSDIAPTLVSRIATPSASVPETITANDRMFCLACHTGAYGTWDGTYVGSSHASSTATSSVGGEYSGGSMSRRVGECANCHNPMGRNDGSGQPIAKLGAAEGRAICDSCHRSGGAAGTDLARLAYSPTTPGAEIVAAFPAEVDSLGRYAVWSRESSASGEPAAPLERHAGSIGPLAAGDVDGDGARETLLADSSSGEVTLLEADALKRVSATLLSFPAPTGAARLLAVGDVFVDGSGRPEVVVVAGDGTVDVLRMPGGSFSRVLATTESVSGTPKGIAVGDVNDDSVSDVAVVTTDGLFVFTASGSDALAKSGPYATGGIPVGVAIADLMPAAGNEIAVVNGGIGTSDLAVLQSDGTVLDVGASLGVTRRASGIVAGDVLPGQPGDEVVIGYRDDDAGGSDGVRLVRFDAGGVAAVADLSTGSNSAPAAFALGDADNDGEREVVVALSGTFSRSSNAVPPSVRVLRPNAGGTGLTTDFSLEVSGSEAAGGSAGVVVADMGVVPPSRHPVSVVPGSHVSTESALAQRHVECTDCHSPHEASSAASDTPDLPGELIGAWGREPINNGPGVPDLDDPARVSNEYSVCLKCHTDTIRSIGREFNTDGVSYHPVEAPAKPNNAIGSTLLGVSAGDTIRCSSCHGSASSSGPSGPHRSTASPLLAKRLAGATGDDSTLLCLTCHKARVYLSGEDDDRSAGLGSGFYDSTPAGHPAALHSYHTGTLGLRCDSCHLSHGGGSKAHLLRDDTLAWSVQGTGGRCTSACHTDALTPHTYDR